MQNLPSRGANAGKIKKAIKAPPGYVVIDCDSAQIEARVLAWLAGQDDLVQAFRDKQDVYKLMAHKIYNVPVDQIDKTQRQVGKTVVLGAGYGVGHVKLQGFLKTQGSRIPTQGADLFKDVFSRAQFPVCQGTTVLATKCRIGWAKDPGGHGNAIIGRTGLQGDVQFPCLGADGFNLGKFDAVFIAIGKLARFVILGAVISDFTIKTHEKFDTSRMDFGSESLRHDFCISERGKALFGDSNASARGASMQNTVAHV
jgi:hypothetical protein